MKIAPQIREQATVCKNRPGCRFISEYANFDGPGEYFSENLVAYEWLGEEFRRFDPEAYAMVEEVLQMLL